MAYLSSVMRGNDGRMTIELPRAAWDRLRHEVWKQMQEHSVRIGNGGIVAQYPPPQGEDWGTGFWLQGHWIKSERMNRPCHGKGQSEIVARIA